MPGSRTQQARQLHAGSRLLQSQGGPDVGAAHGGLSPRWLSDLKLEAERLTSDEGGGSDRATRARRVLEQLDRRWIELSAGAEGFLSGPRWTGVDRHQVAWGDMVRGNPPV